MKSTTNHETIKNWILRWDGFPAMGTDSDDGSGKGIFRINFPGNRLGEPIEWDEFFDIFETDRLTFVYNDHVEKGGEEFAFSFIDRDKNAPLRDDETELPEVNTMAEENMYDNFEMNQSY